MTRATPRSAAPCERIEIHASRRVAAAWIAWLLLLCAAMLFGVALPLYARIVICVAATTSTLAGVRGFVLLHGPHAVRALEWAEAGEFIAYVGSEPAGAPASLARGSFRLGAGLVVLRLAVPNGVRSVLIDGGIQDTVAFRRLCRRLAAHSRGGSDTIQPKV